MPSPKEIRIVFMGTPGFAAGVLQKLISEHYNVVAVITAPDKPAGRGLEIHQSEVKKLAVANHIPVLQPEKLKSEDFLSALKVFEAELQIVVAFRMLPEVVWKMPSLGTFNLHASLLPDYRGAAPINRAIMNGETKTGVTTFFLQQAIDTGNILLQQEMSIGANETAGELHDRMMEIGSSLVVKTIDGVANNTIIPVPQVIDQAIVHDAPKIFRDDCRIDWNWSGKRIHDHVRGLSPYPTAWANLRSVSGTISQMKIFKTIFTPITHAHANGSIGNDLSIYVQDGMLQILELQSQGKKRMDAQSWLRGNRIQSGDLFI